MNLQPLSPFSNEFTCQISHTFALFEYRIVFITVLILTTLFLVTLLYILKIFEVFLDHLPFLIIIQQKSYRLIHPFGIFIYIVGFLISLIGILLFIMTQGYFICIFEFSLILLGFAIVSSFNVISSYRINFIFKNQSLSNTNLTNLRFYSYFFILVFTL